MARLIAALFNDSKEAGHAIGELKEKGFTKDISVISKEYDGFEIDSTTHQIKQDVKDGIAQGAVVGAVAGGLATLLAGVTAITIPAAGIFIAGSLASALTGATAGALVGGLVGFLVDKGIPEKRAQWYEDQIKAGDTLVAVTVSEDRESDVLNVLSSHGAVEAQIDRFDI